VDGEGVAKTTLIGSVRRALRLLEAVGSHPDGAPAKQLARETGLPLATTYHLLRTLAHDGYLRRENGVFVFGEAAERLGSHGAQQRHRAVMSESLAALRDELGVPVYFSVYRDGEIDVVSVADTPANPAVEEWAAFRATGHGHAIGQCLLSQLDEQGRKDHLSRHPVQPLTPYTVSDSGTLLRRLAAVRPGQMVFERQEYALGIACAAFPVTAGPTAAALAISVPSDQAIRLRPVAEQLRSKVEQTLASLAFSVSI
jgi:DNA-binding IclR family transcriptional regulator